MMPERLKKLFATQPRCLAFFVLFFASVGTLLPCYPIASLLLLVAVIAMTFNYMPLSVRVACFILAAFVAYELIAYPYRWYKLVYEAGMMCQMFHMPSLDR
jgi:hypothetical protein